VCFGVCVCVFWWVGMCVLVGVCVFWWVFMFGGCVLVGVGVGVCGLLLYAPFFELAHR